MPVPRANLKLIGYWALPGAPRSAAPDWPDIRRAVQATSNAAEREQIAAYLRSGHRWRGFLGFSACRFDCRRNYRVLGNGELTDGEWTWPEGLVHYVERHGIVLPDAFVASAADRGWKVPPAEQIEDLAPGVLLYRACHADEATRSQIYQRIRDVNCQVDDAVWLDWAHHLPPAPAAPPPPDPQVLKRFNLIAQYPESADGDTDEKLDAFDEGVWEKVGSKFGRHAPNVEMERVLEAIALEQRDAVTAEMLDGLRRYALLDHVKLIVSAPDPEDWQRDRDISIWPPR